MIYLNKKDQPYTLKLEMIFALYTYIVANVSITTNLDVKKVLQSNTKYDHLSL